MTLVRKALDELITTTRASSALVRSAAGNWTSVGNDVTRVSVTGGESVALVEEARTNVLLNNNVLTSWTALRADVAASTVYGAGNSFTVSANATSANGTAIYDSPSGVSMAAGTYTMTARVLKDTGWILLRPNLQSDGTDAVQAWFNTATGVVGTVSAASGSAVVTTPVAWVRDEGAFWVLALRFTITSTGTISRRFYVVDADNNLTTTSGRITTVLLPQCELGTFDTSPIITAGSAVTRQADQVFLNAGILQKAIGGPFSVLEIWRARSVVSGSGLPTIWAADNGPAATELATSYIGESSNTHNINAFSGGVNQFTSTGAAYTQDARWKVASRFEAGDYGRSINGAATLVRTGAEQVDGLTRLGIGSRQGGTLGARRLELAQLIFYPTALANADLEGMSA